MKFAGGQGKEVACARSPGGRLVAAYLNGYQQQAVLFSCLGIA